MPLPDALDALEREHLQGNDAAFFRRVWSSDPEVYAHRLKAVGMAGRARVLDAGCGFGQWSHQLVALNGRVDAVEFDPTRAKVASAAVQAMGHPDWRVEEASVEALPYPDEAFDGVWCYSVLTLATPHAGLRELMRVLKPGGRLYACLNASGWFAHNLEHAPNPAQGHNPRLHAGQTLAKGLLYATTGLRWPGGEVYWEPWQAQCSAYLLGAKRVQVAEEGTLNLTGQSPPPKPFFRGRYGLGYAVYEMVVDK